MNVYLAGTCSRERLFEQHTTLYILESFFYVKPWQIKEMKKWKGFLLDSGAFTFMVNQKNETNFDDYVEKYVQFINQHNIERFFELDIDSVVGYERVKEYRAYIEQKTGKKCIPVWHKTRGMNDFLETVNNYNYIAIGGIVTKEITKKQWRHFPYLLNEAHKAGCMVHGLGFTATPELKKYHFDSVDSTNWLSASRFGSVQCFKNGIMQTVKTPEGKSIKHYKILDDFVFGEWIKFQEYAERFL
jgi:hypothetical protein